MLCPWYEYECRKEKCPQWVADEGCSAIKLWSEKIKIPSGGNWFRTDNFTSPSATWTYTPSEHYTTTGGKPHSHQTPNSIYKREEIIYADDDE